MISVIIVADTVHTVQVFFPPIRKLFPAFQSNETYNGDNTIN